MSLFPSAIHAVVARYKLLFALRQGLSQKENICTKGITKEKDPNERGSQNKETKETAASPPSPRLRMPTPRPPPSSPPTAPCAPGAPIPEEQGVGSLSFALSFVICLVCDVTTPLGQPWVEGKRKLPTCRQPSCGQRTPVKMYAAIG